MAQSSKSQYLNYASTLSFVLAGLCAFAAIVGFRYFIKQSLFSLIFAGIYGGIGYCLRKKYLFAGLAGLVISGFNIVIRFTEATPFSPANIVGIVTNVGIVIFIILGWKELS